jgi:hypothetical protein
MCGGRIRSILPEVHLEQHVHDAAWVNVTRSAATKPPQRIDHYSQVVNNEKLYKPPILENRMNARPETLYRGFRIDPSALKVSLFDEPHLPLDASLDNPSRRTDGNELGIYMTTNPTMARQAYASNGKNPRIPTKPYDSGRGILDHIILPAVGIVLKITTEDLTIRRPKIITVWQGHYNNGYAGDEWITDELPPSTYHAIFMDSSRFRGDPHARKLEFDGREPTILASAVADVRAHCESERRLHEEIAHQINTLTDAQRMNPFVMKRILAR